MWVCLNDAFLSIVEDTKNTNQLIVRARRREHLEKLFPEKEVVKSKASDYKYRVFVDRVVVAMVIAKRMLSINYANFKDSVEDQDLKDAYKHVWGSMYGLQAGRGFHYHNFRTSKRGERF